MTFSAIYFDGKESDSRRFEGGKNKMVKEETYTVVAYPGEHTLGLVTIKDKTGILCALINYINYEDIQNPIIQRHSI